MGSIESSDRLVAGFEGAAVARKGSIGSCRGPQGVGVGGGAAMAPCGVIGVL